MATNDNGTSDSSGQMDLDRLIGELETEAARRRAEPGFPHDADARLHFELARRAPNPPRAAAVRDVMAQIQELTATVGTSPTLESAPGRSRRHDTGALAERLHRLDGQVTSLGLAVAAALEVVAGRLEQLDDRLEHLETPTPDAPPPPAPDQPDALPQWRARLAESLPRGERVLYAQSQADDVVAELRGAGVDAYGITSTGSPHRPGPDVRFADLLTHLRAVEDHALGAAVLTGVPEVMTPATLDPLVAELARTTSCVVIISEAPWWWRRRLGAVHADLAVGRPLDPETWFHAFDGVAMAGSAEYDPGGQSYRAVIRARP
ncbi:MAG TPA: hypothetical protein VII76_03490 [Acidimicrobiales bacterium]